jgi:hypothetical protein
MVGLAQSLRWSGWVVLLSFLKQIKFVTILYKFVVLELLTLLFDAGAI